MKTLLTISGAAPVLAAKIIGRVIGQVANGFGKDEQLVDELSVYKAIAVKYPKDTITLNSMFKLMRNRADTSGTVDTSNMTEEEAALWEDASERDQLDKSIPELTALFISAPSDIKAWDNLPTIAQWSLLNAVEVALPGKLTMYKGWADTDRAAGKVNTNAMRLETDVEAAIPKVFKLITEFLANKKVAADLAYDRESGIAVPIRLAS